MNATPAPHFFLAHSAQVQVRSNSLKNLSKPKRAITFAKANIDFREASRREDSNKLRAAFPAPTQQEMAEKASRAIGASPRQIIYWMQMENDMPSWAVKVVEMYLNRIERTARRIEGRE